MEQIRSDSDGLAAAARALRQIVDDQRISEEVGSLISEAADSFDRAADRFIRAAEAN